MLTLTNYRPLRLSQVMDRLFDESLARPYVFDESYALPLDVQAGDDEYVITAAVPGLKSEDLSVEVLGDTVTVRGEIKQAGDVENDGYLLQERRYGQFARTLTLPTALDSAKAEAAIENGVLTLRIPKAEGAKPKTIKVQVK